MGVTQWVLSDFFLSQGEWGRLTQMQAKAGRQDKKHNYLLKITRNCDAASGRL